MSGPAGQQRIQPVEPGFPEILAEALTHRLSAWTVTGPACLVYLPLSTTGLPPRAWIVTDIGRRGPGFLATAIAQA